MDVYALLRERFPELALRRDFSFAKHTTVGCGGRASAEAEPSGKEELLALLDFLKCGKIERCILGLGANVLARDGLFEGVVIRLRNFRRIRTEGRLLFAGAGTNGAALLAHAKSAGLGGLEYLTGIPMTVGGATVMNAGVREGHIADRIVRVFAVGDGGEVILSAAECRFGEKTSIFSEGGLAITGAEFRLEPAERTAIEAREEKFREMRRHLPKGRSFGCAFVNPPGESAGALIERCGLKGTRIGGAYVSPEHGNFLLNEGEKSEDVARLADFVRQTVEKQTGIRLREEFRRIP